MQKYFLTLLLLSSIVNAYTICDDLDIAVQEGFEVETAKQLLQEARRNDLYAKKNIRKIVLEIFGIGRY